MYKTFARYWSIFKVKYDTINQWLFVGNIDFNFIYFKMIHRLKRILQ